MASLPRIAPRRSGDFICLACRAHLRPIRSPQFYLPTRSFNSTVSARNNKAFTTCRFPLDPPKHRSYSTETTTFATPPRHTVYATPPSTAGLAPLPHRRLLAVSGPDAAKFLQGLITNNIDASNPSSLYAAFLNAKGRVLWDIFVWVGPGLFNKQERGEGQEQEDWGCYIEVDEQEVAGVKKHLRRHKLRSKVEVEEVGAEGEGGVRVWAAWGDAGENIQENKDVLATLEDPRAPDLRRYLVRADGEISADKVQVAGVEAYHLHRYRCGVAEGPNEIQRDTVLPMECNIDLNSGIDFKKGCYVGQELTIRTKHTGVVRKRMLPVTLHSPTSISSAAASTSTVTSTATSTPLVTLGADIKYLNPDGSIKEGRSTGKFIAGIGDVGLALCRLENMTSLRISAEGGRWEPGLEFGVDMKGKGETEERIVKVAPVLYHWFTVKERNIWGKGRGRT